MGRFKSCQHQFPEEVEFLSASDVIMRSAKRGQSVCGIYFLIHESEIVYVGKSKNLHQRLYKHHTDADKKFDRYYAYPCPEVLLDKFERHYIAMFAPRYNVQRHHGAWLSAQDAQLAAKLMGKGGT